MDSGLIGHICCALATVSSCRRGTNLRFLLEACLSKEAFLGTLGAIRYNHARKDVDHAVRQGGEKADILNPHYGCGTKR